jgi:3-oxoacyl-[acyl-carrier-protein] synthase-3
MSFTITGTGSAVPDCVKTNDELSRIIDTSDEWIITRTGIQERHICTHETLTDIAAAAAEAALENAGAKASELDLIVCSLVRGDYITPSLACMVQQRIGAHCPAFDVNAACTGFIYALDVADGFFARDKVKKVLVVSAEAMSKLADWEDRSTCVLFGDGAGAVVLEPGDGLLSIRLSARGDVEPLYIPNVDGNCPFDETKEKRKPYLRMHGQDVYKFAVSAMCGDIMAVIEDAGLSKNDIDHVLPHQANLRIIEAAQKRLRIPRYKVLTSIERYGNMSSASIPVLLDEANRGGRLKAGDILVMSAFGGGLTTGACVLRWGKEPDPQ